MIVVWYDNFLVLGEDKEVVEAWKAHIEGRARKCNAQWKTAEEKRQVVESVEFLGLRFTHSPEGWKWQHVDTKKMGGPYSPECHTQIFCPHRRCYYVGCHGVGSGRGGRF